MRKYLTHSIISSRTWDLGKNIPKPKIPNGHHQFLKNRNLNFFLISPTTPSEIIEIIYSLDDSKSSGPCSIPIKLLKIYKSRTLQ